MGTAPDLLDLFGASGLMMPEALLKGKAEPQEIAALEGTRTTLGPQPGSRLVAEQSGDATGSSPAASPLKSD